MKKIAYWSRNNPIKARFIIGLSQFLLLVIGIFLGIYLYFNDFHIHTGFLSMMVIVFSLAYIFYPKRGEINGIYKYSWSRRVKHDIILVLSSTCVLTAGINHFAFQPIEHHEPQPHVRLMVSKVGVNDAVYSKKEIRKGLILKIKEYRTAIKQQLKSLKAERKENGDGSQTGMKIFLILSVVLLAAALGYGVGVLSCNLSCNGQEGMAVLVAVGGALGIAFLCFIAIRAILRMGKNHVQKYRSAKR